MKDLGSFSSGPGDRIGRTWLTVMQFLYSSNRGRGRIDFQGKMTTGSSEVEAPLGQSRGDACQALRMRGLEPLQET